MNFSVPSRHGGSFTLYAVTHADRVTWIDAIEKQRAYLIEHKKKFEISLLSDKFFMRVNPINSAVYSKNHLIVGSDYGLFCSVPPPKTGDTPVDTSDLHSNFVKVLDLEKIYQVDVIVKIDSLLVLTGIREFMLLICF